MDIKTVASEMEGQPIDRLTLTEDVIELQVGPRTLRIVPNRGALSALLLMGVKSAADTQEVDEFCVGKTIRAIETMHEYIVITYTTGEQLHCTCTGRGMTYHTVRVVGTELF